jgi:hypothetical protein
LAARISTMLIAFATVVEKELRWTFSGCLALEAVFGEGDLTLFDVGDILVQPCFTRRGYQLIPLFGTSFHILARQKAPVNAMGTRKNRKIE